MVDALIFQTLGIIYLAVGLGLLFHPEFYRKLLADFSQNSAVSYLGGALAVVAGYVLVFYHNVWEYNWSVIITIVGWLAFIKGLLILIFPSLAFDMAKAFKRNKAYILISGVVLIVFGAILVYLGYFVL